MKPLLFLIAMAAAGLLFYLAPEIDLWASAQFYREGERFFLGNWWPNVVIYELVELISWSVAVAFVPLPVTAGVTPFVSSTDQE